MLLTLAHVASVATVSDPLAAVNRLDWYPGAGDLDLHRPGTIHEVRPVTRAAHLAEDAAEHLARDKAIGALRCHWAD